MSKRIGAVFTLFVWMLLSASAQADVVYHNDFYDENVRKTKPIQGVKASTKKGVQEMLPWYRPFVVNSPDGYVIPKQEPGSSNAVKAGRDHWGNVDKSLHGDLMMENGDIIYIRVTYLHEGIYWSVTQPSHANRGGWIAMDDLLMVYEPSDFDQEYQEAFYPYTGSYDAVLNADNLVEWQWPGSDQEKRIIEGERAIDRFTNVQYAYKDAEGREWGKASYGDGWICLTDPNDSTIIPAFFPAPEPKPWSPDGVDWQGADAITYPAKN